MSSPGKTKSGHHSDGLRRAGGHHRQYSGSVVVRALTAAEGAGGSYRRRSSYAYASWRLPARCALLFVVDYGVRWTRGGQGGIVASPPMALNSLEHSLELLEPC